MNYWQTDTNVEGHIKEAKSSGSGRACPLLLPSTGRQSSANAPLGSSKRRERSTNIWLLTCNTVCSAASPVRKEAKVKTQRASKRSCELSDLKIQVFLIWLFCAAWPPLKETAHCSFWVSTPVIWFKGWKVKKPKKNGGELHRTHAPTFCQPCPLSRPCLLLVFLKPVTATSGNSESDGGFKNGIGENREKSREELWRESVLVFYVLYTVF